MSFQENTLANKSTFVLDKESVKRKPNRLTLSKSNKGLFILFFIWPFAAFLMALSNYQQKDARRIMYFFLIYYGFTFAAANLAMDSRGFEETLKQTAALPFSEFYEIIVGFYAVDTSVDIIQPFIVFVVSRITDDSRFLFAVFAAVFGYFYLKSIDPLYSQYKRRPNRNALVHLVFFVLLIPIFEINGFRFWTAAWVFFYGAYHLVLYGDKKFLLFTFLAAFIHFSFLTVNIVLIAYVFLGNRNLIYYPLMVISFIVPELFASQINQLASLLPGGLEAKYVAYSNQEYGKQIAEGALQAKWFMKWPRLVVLYYLVFSLLFIQIKYRKWVTSRYMNNLFSFTLLLLSFSNFLKYIPTLGRFQSIFFLFGIAYLIHFFELFGKRNLHILTKIGFLPMLIVVIVVLRVGLETMNVWVFAPWPFALFAPGIPVAPLIF
jgi:hypothetical protein